jgi:PAS domain S-box-containing protein
MENKENGKEQENRETLEHAKAIIESSHDAIIEKNLDGVITGWNRGAERIYGYTAKEVIGRRISILIPPDHSDKLEKFLERIKEGKPVHHFETSRIRKDGQMIYVSLTISPVRDAKGNIISACTIARDISERKKAEEELRRAYFQLKETQDQLIQAEKLNTIGLLASGVAHEVRNPLAMVLQGVNYFERKLSLKEKDDAETLHIIKENIKKADKIIKSLLDFSKGAKLTLQPEDINSILENSLALIKSKIEFRDIDIVMDVSEDLPKVLVDKNKIEQVFVNELLNAIEAIPKAGKIIIRSYGQRLEEIKNGVGRRKEDYFNLGEEAVMVEIEDTGTGISEEDLKNIFTPFFTTKRSIGGIGLGLSVSKNILDMHKALVWVKSKVGQGTKVIMAFKIAG